MKIAEEVLCLPAVISDCIEVLERRVTCCEPCRRKSLERRNGVVAAIQMVCRMSPSNYNNRNSRSPNPRLTLATSLVVQLEKFGSAFMVNIHLCHLQILGCNICTAALLREALILQRWVQMSCHQGRRLHGGQDRCLFAESPD